MIDHAGLEPGELLPHGAEAVLMRRVVDADDSCLRAIGVVPADSVWTHAARPAAALLELSAQAAALHGALLGRRRRSPPRRGMLVGARELTLAAELPVDAELMVEAAADGAANGLALYRVRVTEAAGGRELLLGTLSVFVPEGDA